MEVACVTRRPPEVFQGASLPELLAEQAALQPDVAAVVGRGHELTFRELVHESAHVAGRLRDAGLGADDCVGLFVEPSPELVVGVWGVLTAGAAYLPLAPEYPDERLRYMIEDSGTGVVVTQGHLVARLRELAPRGTRIVELGAATVGGPAPAHVPPSSTSLAYVIYTSGSTGRPKGVMIEHRSIVSQMRWLRACAGVRAGTRVVQKTPISFDAAQWEILAPAAGAQVVVGPPGLHRDPEELIALIVDTGATTLQCVPSLLQALVDTDALRACTSLRYVFSGGEALSRQLARSFYDALPWASLVNLYGPTECTINATAHFVDPDELGGRGGTVPIGTPVDNTQCFVLDDDLDPVGVEENGELYIGGAQLARGYLNRPDETRRRFVPSPFAPMERLYRTGDVVHWNPDGTLQFCGRTDNQVKLRGYRIELDEISTAIEEHLWVKRAAATVVGNESTGAQQLVAFVELNEKEAALMDHGRAGAHHRSKADRLQVKAQLSDGGVRATSGSEPVVPLPDKRESASLRRRAFARKTYRHFEGDEVTETRLLQLLAPRDDAGTPRDVASLTLAELGAILRAFGQFHSDERLLPKYAYASPGALYATQLYVEIGGIEALAPGTYYYHPVDHSLVLVAPAEARASARLRVHFLGKRDAIEPVYKNNVLEVLELETGHMVGLFDDVLPPYGLRIAPAAFDPAVLERIATGGGDAYLGTFEIAPDDGRRWEPGTRILVQVHPGRVTGMPPGQYEYVDGRFERVGDELVESKHVIAINQHVYARASFGVTLLSVETEEWLAYVALGRIAHRLQANECGIGLMSSGYSSKSGHPLPAARRVDDIAAALGIEARASYFLVGGGVSDAQRASEGMLEDAVHMRGPAEIVRDELAQLLPRHMVPDRITIVDRLPLTANGKIDLEALAARERARPDERSRPYVAPATPTERRLAAAWRECLHEERVSADADFFGLGGNSLTAVSLINKVNRDLGVRLPYQAIFETPRLADLAARIDRDAGGAASRLVLLRRAAGRPIFCWPGLGGYPMNLRHLARRIPVDRPVYGVQALGLNDGEEPPSTIAAMAAADVSEIRRVQRAGPYTLIGYSFGARIAFETAWQLERLGETVDHVLLVCPGNPMVEQECAAAPRAASFDNRTYVTILYSVFAGTTTGGELERCLAVARDEDSFVSYVATRFPELDAGTIRRITRIVARTFEFEYTFRELTERKVAAPVALYKARGDDYSFVERASGYSAAAPAVHRLAGDHYGVLQPDGVDELAAAVGARLTATVDRVSIGPSPAARDVGERRGELSSRVTERADADYVAST